MFGFVGKFFNGGYDNGCIYFSDYMCLVNVCLLLVIILDC